MNSSNLLKDKPQHFLDSGAFSVKMDAIKWGKRNNCDWLDYYETKRFIQYMEEYVAFVKKHHGDIDLYANLDVSTFARRKDADRIALISANNQKWLEERGLKPIPVIHYPEPMKWLRYYMDLEYPIIGVGGLSHAKRSSGPVRNGSTGLLQWIAEVFDIVCSGKDRLPKVKLHGFGVTTPRMLFRYPWWSVDSSAWAKRSGYGFIYVPHIRNGKYIFDDPSAEPYIVHIACERPKTARPNRKAPRLWKPPGMLRKHFLDLSKGEQRVITNWLDYIEVPLGTVKDSEKETLGVMSSKYQRDIANLKFFYELQENARPYPWAFKADSRGKGFGLL